METLQVVIKPHHLKGNSWSHRYIDPDRECPLREALEEMGYKNAYVGGMNIMLDMHNPDTLYQIPMEDWNPDLAEEIIHKANGGSMKEVIITLSRLKTIEYATDTSEGQISTS